MSAKTFLYFIALAVAFIAVCDMAYVLLGGQLSPTSQFITSLWMFIGALKLFDDISKS